MKHFLWLVLFLPFLTGCASELVNMSNNYSTKDIGGRKVLILGPALDSIDIKNTDDIRDDFDNKKDDARKVLRGEFYKKVLATLEHDFETQKYEIFESDTSLEIPQRYTTDAFFKQYPIGEDKTMINFYLPTKEWLISKGKTPDIVILISTLTYGRDISAGSSGGYFMPGTTVSTPHGSFNTGGVFVGGGGSISKLNGFFSFIIYDYKKDTWINYGAPQVAASIPFWGLTKGVWEDTFEMAAQKLLGNSAWETLFIIGQYNKR